MSWPAGPAGAATTADSAAASQHVRPADQPGLAAQRQPFQALVLTAQLTRTVAAERAAARRAARKAAAARAAARQAALLAQRPAAQPQAAPQPSTQAPAPVPPVGPSGSPQVIAMSMLGSYGWPASQFGCLDALWSRESGWNVTAANPDGAYGIPQALPGAKMASAGPDWQTDAATQIRWGLGYIRDLYGSPCGAWAHEEATGWY